MSVRVQARRVLLYILWTPPVKPNRVAVTAVCWTTAGWTGLDWTGLDWKTNVSQRGCWGIVERNECRVQKIEDGKAQGNAKRSGTTMYRRSKAKVP